MIRYGASIEYGAENWQVYQHKNRKADITFGGTWLIPDGKEKDVKNGFTAARIVSEENSTVVVKWTQCPIRLDGTWEFTFRDVPAGGPYRIDANMVVFYNDGGRQEFRADGVFHICVGEVFIIAGQSNASGVGRDSALDMPELGISLFRNNEHWDLASHPLNDDNRYEHSANAEHSLYHAPWLAAAKEYKRMTGLPVGLVQTSLGGSGLGHWNPEWDGDNAGYLYRNMIDIVCKCGTQPEWVLWYQGCSDTGPGARDIYLEKFTEMLTDWRRDMKNDRLKFLTVQLNRFCTEGGEDSDEGWGKVREAQRKAAETLNDVYVIPATDISMSDGIHNNATGNCRLGMRAGKMCAEVDLGIHVHKAPSASKAYIKDDGYLYVEFNNLESHIFIIDGRKEGNAFSVYDAEGKVPTSAAECCGRGVRMKIERETKGEVTVNGMWQMNPISYPPVDFDTYLPILSFYGLKAEK